jgi:uncharacterized protein YegL
MIITGCKLHVAYVTSAMLCHRRSLQRFFYQRHGCQVLAFFISLGNYFHNNILKNTNAYVFPLPDCFVPSEIAFALDVSETTTTEDFNNMKTLVKYIMGPLASSENNLHLGIITYASRPNVITQGFRNVRTEEELIGVVDSLTKTADTTTRVDLALRAAKREFFSPKGRMRHGHPKYLIFLTTTAQANGPEDFKMAGTDLREAGVNILSVGMTSTVDGKFLQALASDDSFVFTDATTGNLGNVITGVSAKLCHGESSNATFNT